ncbi:50S ribosomal protein L24 [Candidatus Peregrinibacteria bacterium]|nr:50S ribosomal protein L24 [Candidatus Peregrinibacteria bacterium]
MKLHTGDTVLVISGKDKGKTGSILRVLETENRVIIGGVNMRTRHVKKTHQQAGRILKYEASLSASNVMILDPKTGKPSRIGYKFDDKGRKIRVSKISGDEVKAVKPKKEVRKKADETQKEIKEIKEAKDTTAIGKKQPFWKRIGFGAQAAEEQVEVKEASHMQQDHTIPSQQLHSRSAGRGS